MQVSMYDASVPVFTRLLTNLSTILDKAIAHADAKKIDEKVFASGRLFPDMLPFTTQVNIACDTAKFAVARLAGVEAPKHEDNQVSLADCKARVQSVLAYIAGFKPEQINASEDKDITIPMRAGPLQMKGKNYLLMFATPNFYFHVTTAYALLRSNGVEIGKMDFLGKP